MNELDFILIFIVLLGIGIGWRRGLVRVLISIAGFYFVVLVAGYGYQPIGDTLTGALGRLSIELSEVSAHNFSYVVVVAAMTVAVELISRTTFERTRILALRNVDKLLGAVVGILYGALWASLFLVPGQYSVAQSGGSWTNSVFESTLVPTLNQVFESLILNITDIFFMDGTPDLLRNPVSQRVSQLLAIFL